MSLSKGSNLQFARGLLRVVSIWRNCTAYSTTLATTTCVRVYLSTCVPLYFYKPIASASNSLISRTSSPPAFGTVLTASSKRGGS